LATITGTFTGNEEIARLLLNSGADVSLTNNNEATPLFYACAFGQPGIVRQLLKRGASVTRVR